MDGFFIRNIKFAYHYLPIHINIHAKAPQWVPNRRMPFFGFSILSIASSAIERSGVDK